MSLPKVLLFSRDEAEGRALLPLAKLLYDSGAVEGMALIATPQEWALQDNPLIHRFYEEFQLTAPPAGPPEGGPSSGFDPEWLLLAIKRALVEERAEVAVFPNTLPPFDRAVEFCWMLEGIRTLVWPDGDLDPERHLRTAPDAAGPLTLGEFREAPPHPRTTLLTGGLLEWLQKPQPAFHRVALPPRRGLMREHLAEIAPLLQGRTLVLGPDEAARELQALAPSAEILTRADGMVECVVDLLQTASGSRPAQTLASFHMLCTVRSIHLVPVNVPLEKRAPTFRYGDYDNEFALGPATHDLQAMARRVTPHFRTRVLNARGGGRDLWRDPFAMPEAPDGAVPTFLTRLERHPLPPEDWLAPFRLPEGERLRVVFVDTQNIAGSVLNHAVAVNRHTPHTALALCKTRHPFIGYPQEESRAVFVDDGIDPSLYEELEAADCFVFFEDDDETTPIGPLDLRPFVRGKRVVHLYIGQRVHREVHRHQRPDRMVVTPLPHLLRMFPRARFYAGFPPVTLEDVPLRPPLSETDGKVRLLHTPSLPHPTLSRFYYHKDTEAFLHAARQVCRNSGGRAELWQVAGWPHGSVMEARLDCDATFNQLRGYHGLSGDEAMFLGRPVVQAFDQFNTNRHREYWGMDVEFPWISTSPDGLAQALADLVEDAKRREDLGRRSRQFMLDYFSPRVGVLPLLWYCSQAPRVG